VPVKRGHLRAKDKRLAIQSAEIAVIVLCKHRVISIILFQPLVTLRMLGPQCTAVDTVPA
jgi:hypothetical protein